MYGKYIAKYWEIYYPIVHLPGSMWRFPCIGGTQNIFFGFDRNPAQLDENWG